MTPEVIKKSWKKAPVELFNAGLALFIGLYIMSIYPDNTVVFIVTLAYTLLVAALAFYIVVFLRLYSHITITVKGIQVDNKAFYAWENIESYFVKEDVHSYNSADIGPVTAIRSTLIIMLKNEQVLRISLDQLSKTPVQIIALFDKTRSTHAA